MRRRGKLLEHFTKGILLCVLSVSLFACNEQGAEYVEDLDMVKTTPDAEFNFGDVKYYSMPDTVVYISSDKLEEKDRSEVSELMLSKVEENMTALGYERLPDGADESDLFVTISAIETKYVGYHSWDYWHYWDYWYWWGPYYPGPWNPIYPSPAPSVVYTYDVGTVIIDIIDGQSAVIQQSLPIVWEASINGLLTNSKSNMETRISTYIDQAFDQSPYLGHLSE